MRGSNGAPLWRTTLGYPITDLVPVVAADGRGGVLAVGGESVSGPDAFGGPLSSAEDSRDQALQLTLLDATGKVVWERLFDAGQRARAFVTPDADRGVVVARAYPAFAGTFSSTGNAATDLLVTVTDRVETPAAIESTTTVLVLDGATGLTARQVAVALTDARPRAIPFGDVSGDGRDDVIVVSPGRGPDAGVRALAGDDLRQLWNSPSLELPVFWSPADIGDVDADGVPDLVVSGYNQAVINTSGGIGPLQHVVAFGAATGKRLFSADASEVVRLGDVDGLPGSEVGLQSATGSGPLRLVSYVAMTAAGKTVYSESHRLESATESVELKPNLGDVDGDGVGDAGHGLGGSDDQDVVVSGKTGTVLRAGAGAVGPVGVLVAGRGAELVRIDPASTGRVTVSVVDGLLGATLWTSPPLRGSTFAIPRTADVTGDGCRDLVVDFVAAAPPTGAVLDGCTGALLWQTANVTS